MTLPVKIGHRYGNLTVLSLQGRGAGKARLAACVCTCGQPYNAEANALIYGRTSRCRKCANPRWYGDAEAHIRAQFVNYRGGAARRGYDHQLSLDEFREIYTCACHYCGLAPAKGIDRRNNEIGYLIANCVPCCKNCNLAKRDMTEDAFLAWVARIAAKQGFSL